MDHLMLKQDINTLQKQEEKLVCCSLFFNFK